MLPNRPFGRGCEPKTCPLGFLMSWRIVTGVRRWVGPVNLEFLKRWPSAH